MSIPLFFPHGSTATQIAIYYYLSLASSVGPTAVFFKRSLAGAATQITYQVGPTAQYSNTVTVSTSEVIDNTSYEYYIKLDAGNIAGTFTLFSGTHTYQITDFSAACGM